VTPAGVELERTYKEYVSTVFAHQDDAFQSCQDCHMESLPSREVVAVYDGVRARARHSHLFPAVDVPLTPFPHREAMVTAVERLALPQSIGYFAVETSTMDARVISVKFETQAGHAQPSGAAQDRRMWLEVRAFNADRSLRYESGAIDDGELEEVPEGMPGHDPDLCMMRDRLFDSDDPDDPDRREVHMFWEARDVESALVPAHQRRAG
jgi:hypothetical protein